MLIIGVAEPIVLMHKYMYTFATDEKRQLPADLYLAWFAWSCIFAAIFLWTAALCGACRFTNRFTRFSGEIFGFLVSVLFIQQFIEGIVEGFHPAESDSQLR